MLFGVKTWAGRDLFGASWVDEDGNDDDADDDDDDDVDIDFDDDEYVVDADDDDDDYVDDIDDYNADDDVDSGNDDDVNDDAEDDFLDVEIHFSETDMYFLDIDLLFSDMDLYDMYLFGQWVPHFLHLWHKSHLPHMHWQTGGVQVATKIRCLAPSGALYTHFPCTKTGPPFLILLLKWIINASCVTTVNLNASKTCSQNSKAAHSAIIIIQSVTKWPDVLIGIEISIFIVVFIGYIGHLVSISGAWSANFFYSDIWVKSESNLDCLSKIWVQTRPKKRVFRTLSVSRQKRVFVTFEPGH